MTAQHLAEVAAPEPRLELEIDRFVRAFVTRGITVGYAGKAFLVTAFADVDRPTQASQPGSERD